MRSRFMVAVLLTVCLGAGCSVFRSASAPAPIVDEDGFIESGFLTTEYADLVRVEPDASRRVYQNRDLPLSSYDKILIDRITIWRDHDHKEPVESDDFQRVVDALHAAVSREFGKSFALVDEPGPGVAHMRVALVAIDDPDDRLDVYISHGDPSPVRSDEALPAGIRRFGRQAWMEAEIKDAVSTEPIFAVVDRVADVIPHAGPIETWRDLHEAFDGWAEQGARRVAELKKKS